MYFLIVDFSKNTIQTNNIFLVTCIDCILHDGGYFTPLKIFVFATYSFAYHKTLKLNKIC